MNKGKIIFVLSLLSLAAGGWLLLNSFKQASLEPKDYVKWLTDAGNGLIETKEIGAYKFSLFYKPAAYQALMECEDYNFQADSVNKTIKQLEGMDYYTFRIESKVTNELANAGTASQDQYSAKLQYFAGEMQNDISLVDGKDTLPCSLFHYERNFGVSAHNNFILVFETGPQNKAANNKTLVFNDRVLGIGPLNLSIKGKNIDHIPQLKLN